MLGLVELKALTRKRGHVIPGATGVILGSGATFGWVVTTVRKNTSINCHYKKKISIKKVLEAIITINIPGRSWLYPPWPAFKRANIPRRGALL